jgi:glycerophosphoryl diester phosphodiesterase
MKTRFFDGPKPRNFAHQGASGEAPGNTLVSFGMAIEAGADILEMDVHATRDDLIVVLHDDDVRGATNGTGKVASLTREEVRRLDAGYRFSPDGGRSFPYRNKDVKVPTLREVAERFPKIPFNIEIKQMDPPIERKVFDVLRETGHAEITLLAAERDLFIERIRALEPGLPTNFASSEVLEFIQRVYQDTWTGYRPPGRALQIPEEYEGMRVLTKELIEAAHRFGVEVHVWTVNDEADMRRLLAMGVDGIMTDFPALLTRVFRDMRAR